MQPPAAAQLPTCCCCLSPPGCLHQSQEIIEWSDGLGLEQLMVAAAALRDQAHAAITFSPKVFIPLTRLCRDSCGYCTFAQPPLAVRRAYMTLEEVLAVAHLGAQQGCTEALFTLGEPKEMPLPCLGFRAYCTACSPPASLLNMQ
jgi:2-iminoacetate synthase ThiH